VLDVKCLSFNIELQHFGMSSIKLKMFIGQSMLRRKLKENNDVIMEKGIWRSRKINWR